MNTIEAIAASGNTLYSVSHNPDGTIWNNVNQAFEVYNSSNWADYAVPMIEQAGSGYYRGAYPAAIVGVITTDVVYQQAGAYPALGDAPASGIGQALGVNLASINMDLAAVANLQASLNTMVRGAVAALPTPTASAFATTLAAPDSNAYQGRLIAFVTGALGPAEVANIAAYDPVTHLVTLAAPFTSSPVAGDLFIVI